VFCKSLAVECNTAESELLVTIFHFQELTYTSKPTGSIKYYTEDDYKRGLEGRLSNVHIHVWFIQISRTGKEATVIWNISTILLHE
jgi:hypothetical protein